MTCNQTSARRGKKRPRITLATIWKELKKMSAELDRLTASVAAEKTADESLIALVQGLAQQIRDNATDPAALAALADSLDADQAEIAAAVSANTAPPPPTA
jgi:uncharacterized coiled-coil protein SlyX